MHSVCIFCGSNTGREAGYAEATRVLVEKALGGLVPLGGGTVVEGLEVLAHGAHARTVPPLPLRCCGHG